MAPETVEDLQQLFELTAERVKPLTNLGNSDKLALYALYKQSTVGDNDTPQPGMFAVTDRAKWSAWTAHKGKSAAEAKAEYIGLAERILGAK
ncbi:hypothetical protein KFE25_008896 [Diacronema lutheri]|uniref:ACB domain-containing protein n=1 Tax=Diacronema lutheri TaxID=2081491 RepID=A0A8J5XYW4_DIALT|nr:hypothetical protein KFE25_008896 [Diacronema lutheri]